MKGIIFTELVNLVEEKFGYATADKMIQSAQLSNDGAFTSVGTYDPSELVKMVVALSNEVNIDASTLVKVFGRHLYKIFSTTYADRLAHLNNAFELIESIEGFIHVEVKKLYPDAQLPTFDYQRPGENELVVRYRSERPLADACEGLLSECIEQFGELIAIERNDINPNGTATDFKLTRQA